MSNLKKIRVLDLKISQFELSQKTGVHPSRLSLLENDLIAPSVNEVRRLSEGLGMLPEEIFGPDVMMRRLTASRKEKTE